MTPEQRLFYERGYKAGYAAARSKRWTQNDIDTLINWQGTDADLAAELGRSALGIRVKRCKLRKEGLIP
jgi:hypothetical protein